MEQCFRRNATRPNDGEINHRLNLLECKGNYSATVNNMKFLYRSLMGGLFTFGTAIRGLGGAATRPYVTAHPSTASVPITVLLYNGPLLCGFNVAIKG